MFKSFKNQLFRSRRCFSTAQQQDVVIIGGGPGGYVAAIKAAQLGLKVTTVEGRGKLGGTCLNVGCIPSKALLHNSHLFHEAKHDFAKRGIICSDVQLDLGALMASKEKSVKGLTSGIEGLFKKNKVTYSKGWGKITGPNEVSVTAMDGSVQKISAKDIIIATGSEATPLPGVTCDEQMIVSSTGALSFDSVPDRLLVVGAGVIGLELGSVWGKLGSKVDVVEAIDRILPGTDAEIAKESQKFLKKQGMSFQFNTFVKGCQVVGNEVHVAMESKDGSKETKVYDKVLIAIGRRPYTEGLGLEEMGITMEGRQVATNDHWQSTSHPNIYGIGDVIKGPMLAHKAEEEGIAVAEMLANKPGHVNYDAIPSVVYTHPEIAWVGKNEEELKAAGVKYTVGKFPFMANSRARTNDDAQGLVKILSDKETDRMLGVHIVGANAGEMIAEGVIAIEYGASSEDIARTCHAHPTLSEAFKEACMAAHGKPIHF